MLKNYLKIALKVLVRRKFFTFISLFGISFTLVVLMVVTAILDHMLAPMAPESRQDRIIGVYRAAMFGRALRVDAARRATSCSTDTRAAWRASSGCRSSPAAATCQSYLNGQKIASTLKRTDGEFWQILDFTFLEGAPYTTADVENAAFVAVINETTKRRFFGDGSGDRPDARSGRPALPRRRRRPRRVARAVRAVLRYLGAADDGEDRCVQARAGRRLPGDRAGDEPGRAAAHPRAVQHQAGAHGVRRSEAIQDDGGAVRDEVRFVRARGAVRRRQPRSARRRAGS